MKFRDLTKPLYEQHGEIHYLGDDVENEDGVRVGVSDGYEVSTDREQLRNWLESEGAADLYPRFRKKYKTIAILNGIRVDENYRNQGYGTELLEMFLDSVTADAIILVADKHESQARGFNLKKWYNGYGFRVIRQVPSGQLMLLDTNKKPRTGRFALYPDPDPSKRVYDDE